MNSLYAQDNFHPDLNEFPVRTRQLLPGSKNEFPVRTRQPLSESK